MTVVHAPSSTPVSRHAGQFPWRFIGLTAAISWGCWFIVTLTGVNAFTSLEPGVVLVLGGFGPAIAGVYLTARSGDAALQSYWQRLFDGRRIKPLWLVPIFTLYPVVILLAHLLTGSPVDSAPLTALLQNPGSLLTTLIFVFIFGPFSEEPGWRGYALDWLQARYSAFVASLLLGVIWWAWHLPLVLVNGSFLNASGLDPVFLAGYLGTVVIYSVLFTWVYNHNRQSILAVILFHFSINLTSRLITVPAVVFPVATVILLVVMVLVLVTSFTGKMEKLQ